MKGGEGRVGSLGIYLDVCITWLMSFILHASPCCEKARGKRQKSVLNQPQTCLSPHVRSWASWPSISVKEPTGGPPRSSASRASMRKPLNSGPDTATARQTERRGRGWQCPEGTARGGEAGFNTGLPQERTRQQSSPRNSSRLGCTGQPLREMPTPVPRGRGGQGSGP